MRRYAAFVLTFVLSLSAEAQWGISVTTSKSSYEYGETIQVNVRLWNAGALPETLFSPSTCVAWILPDTVSYGTICGAMEVHLPFNPGDSRTWIWHIVPSTFGYPTFSGHHRVYGSARVRFDSADFDAPAFRGGPLYVKFHPSVPQNIVDSIRLSLNAVARLHFQDTSGISEDWLELGFPLDSLVAAISRDPRVKFAQSERSLVPDSMVVSGVAGAETPPVGFQLRQNYPNPFNPSTTISYSLAHRTLVRVSVYNILGQLVADVAQGMQEQGEHSILFDGSFLSSGVYIYTVWTPQFVASKKLVLIK